MCNESNMFGCIKTYIPAALNLLMLPKHLERPTWQLLITASPYTVLFLFLPHRCNLCSEEEIFRLTILERLPKVQHYHFPVYRGAVPLSLQSAQGNTHLSTMLTFPETIQILAQQFAIMIKVAQPFYLSKLCVTGYNSVFIEIQQCTERLEL